MGQRGAWFSADDGDTMTPTLPVAHTTLLDHTDPFEQQLERILRRVPPLLRLPRPGGRCPYTSLPRTSLVEIVAPCARNRYRPPVPVAPLKRNERVRRGVYLIPAERLFRYLLTKGKVETVEPSSEPVTI